MLKLLPEYTDGYYSLKYDIHLMESIGMKKEKNNKYPAKKIFCPITYACIDSSGRVVKERMGVGIGISQKSIMIEANSVIASQNILLSYVAVLVQPYFALPK